MLTVDSNHEYHKSTELNSTGAIRGNRGEQFRIGK